jgi:hypothetical protein
MTEPVGPTIALGRHDQIVVMVALAIALAALESRIFDARDNFGRTQIKELFDLLCPNPAARAQGLRTAGRIFAQREIGAGGAA